MNIPAVPAIAPGTGPALSRRLRPLYVAQFFQSLALWVPIEKLFMTEIGFSPATVGLMAAVYAVIVPVLEVPSGILADRWSRRGVLVLASFAVLASVVIGGLSQNVPMYLVAAAFLGVFFALQSGTFESLVYDTVLEETGDSEAFERTIGRVRMVESVALVSSALVGGLIAQVASLRAVYFLTVPLLLLAAVILLRVREPQLHKTNDPVSLRAQIAETYRTVLGRADLRLIVLLTVAGALLMQGMFEFGPLWLVALLVPPFLYGPHWAGLTGALGIGGMMGAQHWVTRDAAVRLMCVAVVASGLILVLGREPLLVVGAQVLLTLLVVAVSIPVTRSLHDAVPSAIRAGVASGVGTLTWLAFVPFALVVGAVSEGAGIDRAGLVFVGVGVATAALMLVVLPRARPTVAVESEAEPAEAVDLSTAGDLGGFAPDRFLPADHPDWPGHWATWPADWAAAGVAVDSAAVQELARAAIADLPSELRQVVTLRDIEGRSPEAVRDRVGIDHSQQRVLLQQARSLVRARLDREFEERRRMT